MKILTLLGSARKKGNTAAVLTAFEKLVSPHAEIERINLAEVNIYPCKGCDACQKVQDQPGCRQKDDALRIFECMRSADLVLYATPLYVWDCSAQMKVLWDRQYSLVKYNAGTATQSLIKGKQTALLVTCGGPLEDNADVIQVIFRREMEYSFCQVAGIYIVADCTTPRELGGRAEWTAGQMLHELLGKQDSMTVYTENSR
ncbi:MAG: hypothetical protein CVU39_19005 [Chloroflexi bacterium HGW-Chloroflexi-10]|nr:MAG: hypothetical protein CVU39_19005 [Chloroflexi bacterium HGW-Chloroflexi-10]